MLIQYRQRYWKVKAQVKAEMKQVRSLLDLDLDLNMPRGLRIIQTCTGLKSPSRIKDSLTHDGTNSHSA